MNLINFLDHTIVTDHLVPGSIVLDLGGNKGFFAEKISREFGASVFVFEPVPDLFDGMPSNNLIKKYNEAVMPVSGELVEINLSDTMCATAYGKTDKSIKAKTVTLEEIIKRDGIKSVSLLKMDIEGPEIPILENIGADILNGIDQITIEFHDFLWPELKPRVEAIKRRIEKLGYYCISFSLTNNGDVLFIKKEKINFLNYLYLAFWARFVMGGKRKFRKLFN